jgi:chitinase
VAYFPSWGVYQRNYHVADIPTSSLTHINYAFANIRNGECVLGDPYADIDKAYPGDSWDPGSLRGSFHQLEILKLANPDIKVMISVGGWTWSSGFSDVALSETSRQKFVESCIDLFLKSYGNVFDGIDIDWEYPVEGGASGMVHRPEDKGNYVLLMEEFRRQMNVLEEVDGQDRRYELSIAAAAGVDKIANLDVSALVAPLDFVNLMTYDFHGAWDPQTNFHAALEKPAGAPGDARFDSVDAVAAFLEAGAPAQKISLGVPFYGRGWTGVVPNNNGLFQSATGPSQGTWEAGIYDYRDLVTNYIGNTGWVRYWNETAKSPYLWNASAGTFITYDDVQSIRAKASWAKAQGLGGVMFWDLSGDTSSGELLAAVNEGMAGT